MGTRDLRKEKLDRDEENFPSLVLGDKEKTQATQESKESAKTGETLPAKKTVPEKEGRNNLDRNPGEEKPANPDPDARSLNPGHEGSGTALQNNPLLAYTAYFERLFLEHSGEQTALSQIQSEPEFASLIASYYSSFTAIIDIKLQYDPMITAAKQSWLSAFKAGAKN